MTAILRASIRALVSLGLAITTGACDMADVGTNAPSTHSQAKGKPSTVTSSGRAGQGVGSMNGDDQQRKLEELISTPQYAEIVARTKRVAARGKLAIAFTEQRLPAGLVAIVRIGQREKPARLMIVSSSEYNDRVYLRAVAAAFAYEQEHEQDLSPVEIRLHRDGVTEWDSEKLGRSKQYVRQQAQLKDEMRVSREHLKAAARLRVTSVAGFSRVRIVP